MNPDTLTAAEYIAFLDHKAKTAFSFGERLDTRAHAAQVVGTLNYLKACYDAPSPRRP